MLDLFFVSDSSDVSLRVEPNTIIDADQQDVYHIPYDIAIDYCLKGSTVNSDEKIRAYCYRRGNYERMSQHLNSINFAHEFNSRTMYSAYEYFQGKMNELVLNNVPQITIRKYINKPKWWNGVLQ